MKDTLDMPTIIFHRRKEVNALCPAYHELMMLYHGSILTLTMLCHGSGDAVQRYQALSLELREAMCLDAFRWCGLRFDSEFTDRGSARRLDILDRSDHSPEYIDLASRRDDALRALSAALYSHPLIRTQVDLMDAVRARLQDMERRLCLWLGYRSRSCLLGDPDPEFYLLLKEQIPVE